MCNGARTPPLPSARRGLLHVFPSFAIGGVPLRMVRVLNHLGPGFSHLIVALDGRFEAAEQFEPSIEVTLLPVPRGGGGTLRSVLTAARLLRYQRPDLLLTYNWGSIEWAVANRLSPAASHIHFEAGFGKKEANGQIARRVWCRRWALSRCCRVVVPSRALEVIARDFWKLPTEIVTYLPNGVDGRRFAAPPRDVIPGFNRRSGELVIGTVAPLRPEKNVGRLLRVFALLGQRSATRLIIAGDGTERAALERLAAELGIADRVIFTGQVQPEAVLGAFDIFALSSDTEQMPNALLEAMAAGRPVAAVDVGDVRAIVCEENRKFIVPRDDHAAFAGAVELLLSDQPARLELGCKNRARVMTEFSQERMFAAYAEIFAAVGASPSTGNCGRQ